MKAIFLFALFGMALAIPRYNNTECYNEEKACGSPFLRKICPYTRWQCRELGYEVIGDTAYPNITGECDRKGPRYFCETEDAAKKCGVDAKFCHSIGFWMIP